MHSQNVKQHQTARSHLTLVRSKVYAVKLEQFFFGIEVGSTGRSHR